jgi:hypothetical protein
VAYKDGKPGAVHVDDLMADTSSEEKQHSEFGEGGGRGGHEEARGEGDLKKYIAAAGGRGRRGRARGGGTEGGKRKREKDVQGQGKRTLRERGRQRAREKGSAASSSANSVTNARDPSPSLPVAAVEQGPVGGGGGGLTRGRTSRTGGAGIAGSAVVGEKEIEEVRNNAVEGDESTDISELFDSAVRHARPRVMPAEGGAR